MKFSNYFKIPIQYWNTLYSFEIQLSKEYRVSIHQSRGFTYNEILKTFVLSILHIRHYDDEL